MARTSGRKGRPWLRAVAELKRQSQVCWLCLEAIDMSLEFPDPGSFSADHVIPLSELDEDDPRRTKLSNLRPAHLGCNSSRGNRNPAEIIAHQEELEVTTSRDWL